MDPSKAFLAAESQKNQIAQMRIAADAATKADDRSLSAIQKSEELDIKRDEIVQNRVIKLAEIMADEKNAEIKKEQDSNERIPTTAKGSGGGSDGQSGPKASDRSQSGGDT
jgi:hypothetical protein